MFLIQKYTQYKAAQAEQQKRKVTEKELSQLNHKIDKLLLKLDEHEPEVAANQDEECVVCVNAKASMTTFPCGHRVVCRKCFVKTIQMAVAQRLLPLRCVICRAKILRLKHSNGGNTSLSSSASQYSIGHQWYNMPQELPQSASLYSVTSNMSAASGVSSASSCSSSSYKTCASSFSATATSLKRKTYGSYNSKGYKPLRTSSPSPSRSSGLKKDNRVAPTPETVPPPTKGKLTLIQEFQREYRNGKELIKMSNSSSSGSISKVSTSSSSSGSSRIQCARLLVNQACTSPTGDAGKVTGAGSMPGKFTNEQKKSKLPPPPSSQSLPSLRLKDGSKKGVERSVSMSQSHVNSTTSSTTKLSSSSFSAGSLARSKSPSTNAGRGAGSHAMGCCGSHAHEGKYEKLLKRSGLQLPPGASTKSSGSAVKSAH